MNNIKKEKDSRLHSLYRLNSVHQYADFSYLKVCLGHALQELSSEAIKNRISRKTWIIVIAITLNMT